MFKVVITIEEQEDGTYDARMDLGDESFGARQRPSAYDALNALPKFTKPTERKA